MKIVAGILGLLLVGAGLLHAEAVDYEASERLTPEALARYAQPGETVRYLTLIQELQADPEELGQPAKNLRLPVRSFPNGRPQTMVYADEAWVSPDMMHLRGRKVLVEHFNADGTLDSSLAADEAVVDRTAMLAVIKGAVKVTTGEDVLTGRGALADLNVRYVKVLGKACITTKRMGDADFSNRGFF